MSKIKQLIESTDPSFQCSTKIEMSASDIMLSAEWDMTYERLRDEEEAKKVLGVNQEKSTARTESPASEQIAHTDAEVDSSPSKTPFRVLICGDRDWTYRERIRRCLVVLGKRIVSPIVVVHGAARGADTIAGEEAVALGYQVETFPADWQTHGKKAGPIRNLQMLDTKPDEVWAFHDNISESKGTKHTYTEAQKRGIRTILYTHDGFSDL